MLVFLMLEKIEDSGILHQSGDEVERAFIILDAIVERGISALQVVAVVFEPQIVENALDDLRNSLVLEDTTITRFGEQPEPGVYVRVVGGEPDMAVLLHKAPDNPVDMTLCAVVEQERDGDVFADDGVEIKFLILGDHLQPEVE